jgi:CheY-like chemotaxis protein/two-component sensor histidine kinase
MQNDSEKCCTQPTQPAFVLPELAHEMRNLMQAVQGLAEIEQRHAANDVSAARLAKISELAQAAADLSTALMTLSGNASENSSGNVAAAVASVAGVFESQYGHRVAILNEVEDLGQRVGLPTSFIKLIAFNIMRNAIEALRDTPDAAIRISSQREGPLLSLSFRNNGPSISERVLQSVFERSVTTKNADTPHGFGLRIVRKLVDRAGGTAVARNAPGGGVVFEVQLPLLDECEDPLEEPQTQSIQNMRGRRFLIVDDDASVREVLSLIIKDLGMGTVTACASGMEALALTDRNFDIVLLDLRMNGLSGQETFRRLEPELQRRVVFVTGDIVPPTSQELAAEYVPPVLVKPVSFTKLCDAVAKITG